MLYRQQADSHEGAGVHATVLGRHAGVLVHSLLTEIQTYKLVNLQGLNKDTVVNQCQADQEER